MKTFNVPVMLNIVTGVNLQLRKMMVEMMLKPLNVTSVKKDTLQLMVVVK